MTVRSKLTMIQSYSTQKLNLVWSPETASKAYIDTCEKIKDSGVAELLSAMAGGWKAKLIVEVWSHGGSTATSIGLAVAASHVTGARHVCIVPDEQSRSSYTKAMHDVGITVTEVVVGEAEEVVAGMTGVDFLVVDCKRKDFARVLRLARVRNEGAVLACKNASQRNRDIISGFRWNEALEMGTRVIRSVFLPVGQGVDIAHVAIDGHCGKGRGSKSRSTNRWIRHIDERSGEEHVFRAVKF